MSPLFTTIEVTIILLEVKGVKSLMDKLTIIRLKEAGRSNRSIERELGIGRKTVARYWKKHLALIDSIKLNPSDSEAKDQIVEAPSYQVGNRSKRKYTPEIDARVNELIQSEIEKTQHLGPHKQKLTATGIFEIIHSEGFDIGKSTILNQVKEKRNSHKEAFIRQEYPLGYRAEFDFGEVKLSINGTVKKYMLAIFSAPTSGFRWARLYESANQKVLMDAHIHFFNSVGGVYDTIVYDNMKNIVKRFIGRHEKELNDEFIKLSLFYGFTPVVTNSYSGNEKGHVEKSVNLIRNKTFTKNYKFTSLESAQNHLDTCLNQLNESSKITLEKRYLKQPFTDYDYSVVTTQKVNKYSFIQVESNYYSVPDYLVGKQVTVKRYLNELKVIHKGHRVCTHEVKKGVKAYSINIKHYLRTLSRKPKAIQHSVALQSIPRLHRCFIMYYQKDPKNFIHLLEKYQDQEIQVIINHLETEALARRQEQVITLPTKAVDAARLQVQAYSQLHLGGKQI